MSDKSQTPIFVKGAIAGQLLTALDERKQVEPPSNIHSDFSVARAYDVAAEIREIRQLRGEHPVGRKIGFTNKNIWSQYNVSQPIWGFMYDKTVHDLSAIGGVFDVSHLCEPRIEPEIVLGLSKSPEPEMDDKALLSCVEWIAHGFEIVQSIYPNWKFTAADSVAAFALHGAYLIGPRHEITARNANYWYVGLSSFDVALHRGTEVIDQGTGANVLGGPIAALRHLVGVLSSRPENDRLASGEIVTTGTLTAAYPVTSGETWRTSIRGLPIEGIAVRFA